MWFFKQSDQDHTIDYIVLLSMLTIAGLAVKFLELHSSGLMLTSVLLSVGYVAWGVLHHKKAGHIDKKIVLEYLGLALLVNVLIYSLIS